MHRNTILCNVYAQKLQFTERWVKSSPIRLRDSKHLFKDIHSPNDNFYMLQKDHTQNLQNDQLYVYPSTKKKDIVTKCWHTQ